MNPCVAVAPWSQEKFSAPGRPQVKQEGGGEKQLHKNNLYEFFSTSTCNGFETQKKKKKAKTKQKQKNQELATKKIKMGKAEQKATQNNHDSLATSRTDK